MSGLYNVIFKENPLSEFLLNILELDKTYFQRYRDVFYRNNYIQVYTRCGGGNRKDFKEMYEKASKHPLYSHDEDSIVDSTYSSIYFNIPDDWKERLVMIPESPDPEKRWEESLANL